MNRKRLSSKGTTPHYVREYCGDGRVIRGREEVLTPNYFEDDPSKYNGNIYGQKPEAWLEMLSHEVGHLNHIAMSKTLSRYLGVFIGQYIRYGHDESPLEKDAEKGRTTFQAFDKYIYDNHSKHIGDLFSLDQNETSLINQLNALWQEFLRHQENLNPTPNQ